MFDVALREAQRSHFWVPVALRGSSEQLSALRQDDEFRRVLVDASLIVDDSQLIEGSEGVAREVEVYREAVSKVPQTA